MTDRLLVVDDEPSVCQLVHRKLQQEGFDVTAAGSAEEALQEIQDTEFALVISDIRMPRMDGISLIRKVKERAPDMEVIFLTAVVEVEVAVAALKLGAYDYITKPFNLDELVVKTQGALEHRRLVLENRHYHEVLERRVRERTRQIEMRTSDLFGPPIQWESPERLLPVHTLARSISHEVNGHLSAVLGFSELLLRSKGKGGDVEKYAGLIHQEGGKILALTRKLLDTFHKAPLEMKAGDLNEVLEETIGEVDPLLDLYPRVKIHLEAAPDPLFCDLDGGQMRQVLLHLILNAAQAMPKGGSIVIRSSPEDREGSGMGPAFSVSDEGEGVPPERHQEIFKPFFTTREKAAGLGLNFCRDTVIAHGGSIAFESEPGQGTLFRVWLPGVAPAVARSGQIERLTCPQ